MRLRKLIEAAVPLLGTAVVLTAVLFLPDNLLLQLVVVVGGILLVEAGVWRLTNPFLPSERSNDELRREVDDFLDLVRELDRAAVDARADATGEVERRVDAIAAAMQESVARMRTQAGVRKGARESARAETDGGE